MLDSLIYVNTALSIAAFLACVTYVVKHRNRFRWLFIWKAVLSGFIAVLYVLIATEIKSSAELIEAYRLIWTPHLALYLAMVLALWKIPNEPK